MILTAGIVVVAVALLIAAFIAPRWSRKPQGKLDKGLEKGQRQMSKAPGKAGDALPKPFDLSEKITDKSAETGRKARNKT